MNLLYPGPPTSTRRIRSRSKRSGRQQHCSSTPRHGVPDPSLPGSTSRSSSADQLLSKRSDWQQPAAPPEMTEMPPHPLPHPPSSPFVIHVPSSPTCQTFICCRGHHVDSPHMHQLRMPRTLSGAPEKWQYEVELCDTTTENLITNYQYP